MDEVDAGDFVRQAIGRLPAVLARQLADGDVDHVRPLAAEERRARPR